jgi:acetylornithine/succinyldiaminopimelate/putrescine aminotransferase/predicted amino acid dehydrogenase
MKNLLLENTIEKALESCLNPTLRRLLAMLRMDHTWERAQGVWLFDSNGRRFMDCYAQYGVLALGHNSPKVRDTVVEYLCTDEPVMVQPYQAKYAEKLARLLTEHAPGNLSRGIFMTSGAEAVEAAIKLVRVSTGRPIVLSAKGSYHGKTLGALALTGQQQHADGFGPLPPGFDHVEFGNADALADRIKFYQGKVAAFFVEPIQGERGVHIPPSGYLKQVREICTQTGIALVIDEIQTGLGRTGTLFACEHEGIAPDVLLVGKALGGGLFPLSGCFTSTEFWDERFALQHSSTFANHNLACRVGLTVLNELTHGGLCKEVVRRGEILMTRLKKMALSYPRTISAIRAHGLMSAIELRPPTVDDGTLLSFLSHQGLYAYAVAATIAETVSVLVLPTLGKSPVIRVTPPLIIADHELENALQKIESVLNALEHNPTLTIIKAMGALEGSPLLNTRDLTTPPRLPARLPLESKKPQYAFLIHYTSIDDLVATNPSLNRLNRDELHNLCSFTSEFASGVVMQAPTIRSTNGASINGIIIGIPLLPEEMARRGMRRMSNEIARAVDLAVSLGVNLVGLGAYTAPYSRRGLAVCGRGANITTGNALTAGMAIAAVRRASEAHNLLLSKAHVAIVGARGSVASLCARLIAREHPCRLTLIGNPGRESPGLTSLGNELRSATTSVDITNDISILQYCNIVITATSAARPIIDSQLIKAGTIICDIARPPDTSSALRHRSDINFIEGGKVELPDPTIRFGAGNLNGLPSGVIFACLAETILLALEGKTCDHGIGYDLPLSEVDEMLGLAERHGFRLAPVSKETDHFHCNEQSSLLQDLIIETEGVLYAN